MSNRSLTEQALEERIRESVAYARELEFVDGERARELLSLQPSIESLREQTGEILAAGLAAGCAGFVDGAMCLARGAIEDAAGLGLVSDEDPGQDAPMFWGLDGEESARLVAAMMLRAGSMVLG